ncbi:MAG: hypothetical protein H6739_40295 [Alphaproteobacteria bacterium]|nr:hypothetical protein [Alphaproteobacteria bacterium]
MVKCTTALMMGVAWMAPDQRPSSTDYIDAENVDVRCHYTNPNHLSICERAIEVLEEVWPIQVDQWGWYPPFPDNGEGGSTALDVYISTDADGGAYVTSPYTDADRSDGRMGGYAHMVLDPTIPSDELHIYVAHEFNHVLQFATDFTESTTPIWEASATWAEGHSYPGEGDANYYAPDFQRTPWASILMDGTALWNRHDIWSFYEYGAVMWLDHLDLVYDVQPLDIWMAMTNDSWENEPDVLDAWGSLTGSWEDALLAFSIERARVGTDAVGDWAASYRNNSRIRNAPVLSTLDEIVEPEEDPYDLGVVYFDVQVDGDPVAFAFEGGDTVRWGVVLVGDGVVADTSQPIIVSESQLVGVVNLGPEGFDSDDGVRQRPLSAWLEAAPADGDTGVAVDDTGGGDGGGKGCGCASGGSGGAAGFWLLGAIALFRRRES